MMKTIIFISIMLMSFMSCKAQKVEQFYGTFYKLKKDKDFNSSYTLELNSDSTFKFAIKVKDGQPQCIGIWKILDEEFIVLKCGKDTNPYEMLTNGYMSQKEHKLQILNKNKIKYKDVILKRKK